MDEPLCPCIAIIPLDYNPSRPGAPPREVEPEVMGMILSWFDRQFGGYTPLGIAGACGVPPGSWNGQPDRSMRVLVYVPQRRTPEFVEVIRRIGRKLEQKAMAYEIGPPSGHILLIEDDDEPGLTAAGGS